MYSLHRKRSSGTSLTLGATVAALAAVSSSLFLTGSEGAFADNAVVRNSTVRGTAEAAVLTKSARFLSYQKAEKQIQLTFVLPLRNQSELDTLLGKLYNPNDPAYHHFLSTSEFDSKFAPTQADYDAVKSFATESGFALVSSHTGRTLLTVRGSVKLAESTFGTKIANYSMADGSIRYANVGPASLPPSIADKVVHVLGLTDIGLHQRVHSRQIKTDVNALIAGKLAQIGTGPNTGALAPSDITKAYHLDSLSLKGEGQSVALVELDGYTTGDVGVYTRQFGLPDANLQNVLINGFSGLPGASGIAGGPGEDILDIDMVMAVAPKVKTIYVYEALPDTTSILDEFAQIADDFGKTNAATVSASFGSPESSPFSQVTAENDIFKKMAAQGQSVFSSTGDTGSYTGGVIGLSDPASQPYVTGVGGTRLTTNGPGGDYVSETTWNTSPFPAPEGGGGGISTVWPKPAYQTGFGKSTFRELPDVSLNSDPDSGYEVYVSIDGGWNVIGGTSAASPLWAAFMSLVNEQRGINFGTASPIGLANPALYSIAGDPTNYAKGFHDITTGNNLTYAAGVGYDDATGLGSFIGDQLLPLLAGGTANLPQGTLAGKVTDVSGNPIKNVTIQAVVSGIGVRAGSAVTGVDGTYTMSLGAGPTYLVSADATGFAGRQVRLTITAGQTTTQDFQLLGLGHVYPAQTIEMISAPYDFTGTADFSTLFGLPAFLGVSDPRVYAWDSSLAQYIASPNAPSDTLHLGQGYWVRFPGAGPWYLHREGAPAAVSQPFRIALQAGWNQIGNPFLVDMPVSSLQAVDQDPSSVPAPIATSPIILGSIYRYVAGTGYTAVTSSDSLKTWEGYWIHASKPSSLVIPAPPSAPVVVGH